MRTVVFADRTNGARSIIAEALFNLLAPSGWHATSAGTDPDRIVSAAALEVLREIGLDAAWARSTPLADALLPGVRRVVWFGADDPPAASGLEVEVWPIADPTGRGLAAFRTVRDQVRARVERLITGLDRL